MKNAFPLLAVGAALGLLPSLFSACSESVNSEDAWFSDSNLVGISSSSSEDFLELYEPSSSSFLILSDASSADPEGEENSEQNAKDSVEVVVKSSSSNSERFTLDSLSSRVEISSSSLEISSSSLERPVRSSSSVEMEPVISSSSAENFSSALESSSSVWKYSSGEFIVGADISHFQEYEAAGYAFYDTDGERKSIFEILRNHGFNYIRLKTFVAPQSPYAYASSGCEVANAYGNYPFAGKDSLISYAKRVKDAGFGLLVDIHYSDNWADPGKQHVPYPWRSITSADVMADSVYAYTYDLISALQAAGATPDMVQVGNEITNGMIRHAPSSDCWGSDTTALSLSVNGGMGSSQGVQNTAKYLKSGFAAVKAVSSSIVTMAHIESPQNTSTIQWWLKSMVQNQGVSFDVMGFSAYESYSHGNPAAWKSLIQTLSKTYSNMKFVIAEYNGGNSDGSYDYDDARYETLDAMKGTSASLGAFFWEPASGGAWGESMFEWGSMSLTARAQDFAEFDAFVAKYNLR